MVAAGDRGSLFTPISSTDCAEFSESKFSNSPTSHNISHSQALDGEWNELLVEGVWLDTFHRD